ncbi:uncharacterized protein VTP21DRAFT_11009 [Calcarisporiella thermophila]|uniref:uncharacterized protein n=1 Tax=Calcarisporiella thermophila TaxID=911321 RepID=UPI003743294E
MVAAAGGGPRSWFGYRTETGGIWNGSPSRPGEGEVRHRFQLLRHQRRCVKTSVIISTRSQEEEEEEKKGKQGPSRGRRRRLGRRRGEGEEGRKQGTGKKGVIIYNGSFP